MHTPEPTTTSTELAATNPTDLAPAQLTEQQQQVVAEARAAINEAYEGQRLQFLDAVGRIVVDLLWDGDHARANSDDPLYLAIAAAPDLRCSPSNLWYAVRLQVHPEQLFGPAGAGLLPSLRKRLLHVADDTTRVTLAQRAAAEHMTVTQLEDAIREAKAPPEGQQRRGPKPLPLAAKKFTPIATALAGLRETAPGELAGLSTQRASELYAQVQALKGLVHDWLPAFEAELLRVRDADVGEAGE